MNRREFIKLASTSAVCGGVGMMAAGASAEPAARSEMDVFHGRGSSERMTINYGTIRAGVAEPFSVLHVSDTHLCECAGEPREQPAHVKEMRERFPLFGGQQVTAFSDAVAYATKRCDFMAHTGDLIDWQTEANLDFAKRELGKLKDALVCAGNHDHYGWLPSKRSSGTEYPFNLVFDSRVSHGVNFVALDNWHGTFSAEQATKFEAEVKKGLPIVMMMHVPIYTDAIRHYNGKFWRKQRYRGQMQHANLSKEEGDAQVNDKTTADMIAYMKAQPLLKGILAGHLHFSMQEKFSPTADQFLAPPNFLFAANEILVV